MKIAMIGQKGIPAVSGGVERHVEEISRRLVSLGHEVTVYYRGYYAEISEEMYHGVKLKYIPTVKSKNLDAITHTFLCSIDSIFKDYDIVHYHAIGPATLSFIPRLTGKKVFVTVHGLDWMRAKWGKLAKAYLKAGERCACMFPHETIVVSRTLQDYYKEKYNRNVHFIPNGVVPSQFEKAGEIKKWGLGENNYILFLARLTPEKGCHHLIKAYKELKTDKKLVIAGGSSNTNGYVSELISHRSENIIFTGHVQGKVIRELYSNALLYVLPSEIEGLPISLLEAMSYGNVCLVSDIPENIEVIKKDEMYGYLFKNGDYKDLSKQMYKILSNIESLKTISLKVRDEIINNYDWDSITYQTLSFYEKILA